MIGRLFGLFLVCLFLASPSNAQNTTVDQNYESQSGNLIDNSQWEGAYYGNDPNNCCSNPAGSGALYDIGSDVIKFSYGLDKVQQSIAVEQALGMSGITVTGYNWSLDYRMIKDGNNANDYLSVDIIMRNSFGGLIHNDNWNLGAYQGTNWRSVSGSNSWSSGLSDVDTITLRLEGRDGGYWAGLYGPEVKNVDLKVRYMSDPCASNPLSDPTCEGYQEAYTEQQCQQDPLYDQSCPGYEQAYTDQQCSFDQTYDQSCPGFDEAYEDMMCYRDPLYSTNCPDYQMALEYQKCEQDPQSSPSCFGYQTEYIDAQQFKLESFGFEDFSMGDTGSDLDAFGNFKQEEFFFERESFYEEQFSYKQETFEPFKEEFIFEEQFIFEERFEIFDEITPELDAFIPEDIKEAIQELEKLVEQKEEQEAFQEVFREFSEEITEENIEEDKEDVVVITETASEEVSDQTGAAPSRRSGSRIGLSVGLGTANSLVANLITNSIESGNSDAAQGIGSGGYFDSGQGSVSEIAGTGISFAEMTNTVGDQSQGAQNGGVDIGISTISLGVTVTVQNFDIEIKEQSLAEKMAESVRKKNLDNQVGIFNKQITMLDNIANGNNLDKYYAEALTDAKSFYDDRKIYEDVTLRDKADSLYRMQSANYGLMKEMIRSQY